jgi:hypothetical protein
MSFTYTRTLPNLTLATRAAAYAKLALLCSHVVNLGTDLLGISIDTTTRVVSATVTNALDADERDHFGLD